MAKAKENHAFVLTRIEKGKNVEFTMTFTINGEEVTYDEISANEKYQFLQVLKQSLGTLARITMMEMGIKPDEE